jgi:hypothetical protein
VFRRTRDRCRHRHDHRRRRRLGHALRTGTQSAAHRAALDRSLAGEGEGEGESAQRALLDLKEAEPRLSAMRRLMREDLGVED